ncbi:MAG: DUF4595 domain-containing protein [Mediterranea sp.]|jgi:hypothetical protein|nr:DUF4595 domain-containing protein [Mediterranea sp.]
MKKIMLIALSALLVAGCKDDYYEPLPHITPSRIQLSQVSSGIGTPSVTNIRTYLFNPEGYLTQATIEQDYGFPEIENTIYTSTVTYTDGKVVVDNGHGTVATYELNINGCAANCELKEGSYVRQYAFTYLTNADGRPYLRSLTETIGDNETAAMEFDYLTAEATLRISYRTGNEAPVYYVATATSKQLNLSRIPNLFISELYPLSYHLPALYGRLLGEPYPYLIDLILPEGTDEGITYRYTLNDNGMVSACTETITNRGRTYPRDVSYVIE